MSGSPRTGRALELVELLEAAASELYNCEATSDANADEQLELARGLRAASARLRDRLTFLRELKDERMAAWRHQVLGELEVINRAEGT